ncbi:undecaprenyl-phosphate glucose phosphotransferase [Microvirga massiliensis]|uniref:undecaprenyl-phosphate glucose phosphotransferase n=1 Tax=Microvirga massiliensis TaxID=1033741 RepID=UPI00066057E1|nr:undecaprenyl-phosphate glucose phosphotransferase [Microvirga massiliensis]
MHAEFRRETRQEVELPDASRAQARHWLGIDYHELGWVLASIDFVVIIALSITSGTLYHTVAIGTLGDIDRFAGAGLVAGGLFVASHKALGLYQPMSLVGEVRQTGRAVLVWVGVFTFFATAAFLLKIADSLSRGTMLIWFTSGLIVLPLLRVSTSRLLAEGLANGALRARAAIAIYDPEESRDPALAKLLRRAGYRIAGSFVATPEAELDSQSDHWADLVSEVCHVVRQQDIDEVLVCLTWRDQSRIDALVAALHVVPLPVRLVPDGQSRPLLPEAILYGSAGVGIEVKRAPLTRSEQVLKRTIDVSFAGLGLFMLMPLLVLVACAIKIDSRGPVLFRQNRTGFNGRTFAIYKFRSMTTLDNGPVIRQTTRNDPRVTRTGRFLRSSSIDELPQLINVLLGHMSLVGPRPHAIAHDDHYATLISDYAIRQHVKPGITGWAQVNGLRGETAEVDIMRQRVQHDLWYIGNWSLLLDLKIIFRTCVQVLTSRNAY